jgi:hypothetical protein
MVIPVCRITNGGCGRKPLIVSLYALFFIEVPFQLSAMTMAIMTTTTTKKKEEM